MHSHHRTTKNYGAAHTIGCYIIRYDTIEGGTTIRATNDNGPKISPWRPHGRLWRPNPWRPQPCTTVQKANQSKPARPTRLLNVVRIESEKALFWSTVYSDGGDHA